MHNAEDRSFIGHPRGLGYIAFAEAWERFSYYGMQTLLVLYMTHRLLLPGHVEHVAGFTPFRQLLETIYRGQLDIKPRGALYALLTNQKQRALTGVVAASTGNHGAAVAYAARFANLAATIFLPENPNPVKRARILALGAKVVERGAAGDMSATFEGATAFARENDHYFLDDASDPLVPVGTATIASELLDDTPQLDAIFVPIGDTALIRGIAAEAKRRRPSVRIIGVQAEQAPAYARSWQEGRVITTDRCDTIADGLATRHPRQANVHAIRELVDEVRLVSERELLDAIRILLLDEHIVAEAAGAAATAAFLQDASAYADRSVALLVTGANVPAEVVRRAMTRPSIMVMFLSVRDCQSRGGAPDGW